MDIYYNDRQLLKYAEDLNFLFNKVREQKRELKTAYYDTIQRLILAAEYKDNETGKHIIRMSRTSAFIARKYGLSSREVENILYASPMHDIGKIGIPDEILLKPGKLTDKEFDIIKTHTVIGAKILENSCSDILKLARDIALTHHEKLNGGGYPSGVSGKDIPLAGRIVAIADVFDAITSKRPYKEAFPVSVACGIILKERGKHFDPDIVDIFLNNIDSITRIKEEVDTGGEHTSLDFINNGNEITD